MSQLTGPYINGAFYNKPSETIYLCVSCANDRDIPEENAIMYDDMTDMSFIRCDDYGDVIRDWDD